MVVPSFLLGFRGRIFAYAAAGVGLVLDAPTFKGSFFEFLGTPAGAALLAGALVGVGLSVEEAGTFGRIRTGIALRLLGPLGLVGAAIWSITEGERPGFVFALGAAFVLLGALHDALLFRDLRYGQAIRLVSLDPRGVMLSVGGAAVFVPLDAVGGAALAPMFTGRGVWLSIARRERIQGDASSLPWTSSTLTQDAFVLTEHQCNLDARDVVSRVARWVDEGRNGYR